MQDPINVFVEGDYAYVVSNGSSTLEIVNVSDPLNPVHAGKIANGTGGAELDDARTVKVKGSYAYVVARAGDALEIIKISDPANPTHAAKISAGDF